MYLKSQTQKQSIGVEIKPSPPYQEWHIEADQEYHIETDSKRNFLECTLNS